MSVSTTTTKVTFAGSGSAGPFPFTFPYIDSVDVAVRLNGVLLVEGSTYSLARALVGSGGSITLSSAITSAGTLEISREMTALQPYHFEDNGVFSAEAQEAALDRIVMVCQQIMASMIAPLPTSIEYNYTSGAEPASPTPYMLWGDTATGFMKIRNSGNTAWVQSFPLTVGFTSAATANAPVLRDAAGKIVGDVLGNAATATSATTAINSTGSGSIPIARYENGLRVIRGTVLSGRGIESGSGFTVASKVANGLYIITYTNAFSSLPTIICSLDNTTNLTITAQNAGSSSLASCVFSIATTAGSATDAKFHFVVIGPN